MSTARPTQTGRGGLACTVKHAGHRVAASVRVRRCPGESVAVCLHLAYHDPPSGLLDPLAHDGTSAVRLVQLGSVRGASIGSASRRVSSLATGTARTVSSSVAGTRSSGITARARAGRWCNGHPQQRFPGGGRGRAELMGRIGQTVRRREVGAHLRRRQGPGRPAGTHPSGLETAAGGRLSGHPRTHGAGTKDEPEASATTRSRMVGVVVAKDAHSAVSVQEHRLDRAAVRPADVADVVQCDGRQARVHGQVPEVDVVVAG